MGTILTFYSYKGGVGRSMALANVAVLLAQLGHKVLMVDWDLEAPGLEFYFKTQLDLNSTAEQMGIIDLIYSHRENSQGKSRQLAWQDLKITVKLEEGSTIDFITAGSRKEDGKEYFRRVRDLDVESFYADDKGGLLIEDLRNEWKQQYEFVLIDSRTGITDIGGICTIQLPDILVLLFTANQQSVDGVVDIAMKASRGRNRIPFDRFSLISVPIPSRFDTQAEFKISQRWLDIFARDFRHLYANWLPRNVDVRKMLEATKIPYISYFSYGEKLPVIEQGTTDPAGLGYAYETLASLIANNFESIEELLKDRGAFVSSAQSELKPSTAPIKSGSGKVTALILSGGGAKGAFQAAVEKYAREVKGYSWDIIAGVSVGALNATMLAMHKYQRLFEIWNTISNEKVYTGGFNPISTIKLLFGAKSFYGNEPLRKLLIQEFEPEKIDIDLRIGTVSLVDGIYREFRSGDPNLLEAVLASTVMPIIWTPENVSSHFRSMVDGGVRRITPIGDVLDTDPNEIIIINCSAEASRALTEPPGNIVQIGMRTLDILLNELFVSDMIEFIRINALVKESMQQGVILHRPGSDRPYKYIACKIIEPDEPLGDTLDFSQATIQHAWDVGTRRAREVFGR